MLGSVKAFCRVLAIAWCAGVLVTTSAQAQMFSVCSDFACGSFETFHSSSSYRPHPVWHATYRPRSNSSWVQYVRRQQEMQRQHARAVQMRREREEKLRQEIARERHLQEVERAETALASLETLETQDQAASDHDERLTEKIVAALPSFERQRAQAERDHERVLERLEYSIDHIHVPSPPSRYIPRVLFLGMTATPDEALRMQREHARDPISGLAYNGVYGFASSSGFFADLPRVADDHVLLQTGFPTASEMWLAPVIGTLKGATIGELVCHSNGCAIAESLIREGVIQVRTLRMLGGDGMLTHLNELATLGERDGIRITAYATVRDPVALLPQGWDIAEWVDAWEGAPRDWILGSAQEHNATYQVIGLAPGYGGPTAVKVQLLSAPGGVLNVVRNHEYSTYYRLMRAWAQTQQGGATGN